MRDFQSIYKTPIGGLNWVQAVEDIKGAAVYLKSQGCTKVAIVGFCMGGALVIASSFQVAELDAGLCCIFLRHHSPARYLLLRYSRSKC